MHKIGGRTGSLHWGGRKLGECIVAMTMEEILGIVGSLGAGMCDLGRLAIPSMGILKNRLDKHLSVITRLGLTPSWLSPGHFASQFSTIA